MTPVVVDALSARLGGGLSYLQRQLPALEAVAPDLELEVLVAPAVAPALRAGLGSRTTLTAVPTGPTASRVAWEQVALAVRRRGAVLYCPGNLVPLAAARRSVLVVQNPNLVGEGRRLPHNRRPVRRLQIALCGASIRRAAAVLAISEALRSEIAGDVPAMVDRIGLLPSGSPAWTESPRRPAGLPAVDRYLVSIANDAPHKRLDVLVEGWAAASGGGRGPALVVAGGVAPGRAEHLRALAGPAADRLVLLGAVADRGELRWLLEHADALVATAVLEAHPLTPAEAGALGCPLVLSDIAAHREVAGAHARYVAPDRADALAEVLRDVPPAAAADRTPWTWPHTWEDNAHHLATVLREVAACSGS